MRHRLTAAALAGLLITASCGGGSDGAESEMLALEREPVDVLLTGALLPTDAPLLEIDDVLWSRGAYRDEQGTLFIPKALRAGDEVLIDTPALLDPGGRYVVVARQTTAESGEPLLRAVGVIDHATNEMLQAFVPSPADLLLPGESGAGAELNALLELVRDSARFHGALEPPGPMSRRLARAMRLAVQRSGGAATVLDERMDVDDYLLLDASRRTLSTDLPVIVADTLGLAPLQARVVLPAGFSDDFWGIGFRTAAGYVGPVEVRPGQTVVDIDGARHRGSGLALVAWAHPPANEVERNGTALEVGSETLQAQLLASVLDEGDGAVLLVDMAGDTLGQLGADEVEALPAGPTQR